MASFRNSISNSVYSHKDSLRSEDTHDYRNKYDSNNLDNKQSEKDKRKLLSTTEEMKLNNFMKINYYLKHKNISEATNNTPGETPGQIEPDKEEFTDKLLLQLRDLEKEPIKSCPFVYYNNQSIQAKNEAKNNKKKKNKQVMSIQSMVLMGKASNVTGIEEKIVNSTNKQIHLDLDDKLTTLDEE